MLNRIKSVSFVIASLAIVVGVSSVSADVIVGNSDYSSENLWLDTLGANTASDVSSGNYVIEHYIGSGMCERPIVPFSRTGFSSVAGQSVTGAQLNFSVTTDYMEPMESELVDVLLFSTNETDLTPSNKDTYAALTGIGGSHTVIGSVSLADGVTGSHSVAFNAAGLSALESAINGTDATIGISFREFSADDFFDGFVFGEPDSPGMTIEVTAVPEPGTGLLAMFGLTVVGWVRRRQ